MRITENEKKQRERERERERDGLVHMPMSMNAVLSLSVLIPRTT